MAEPKVVKFCTQVGYINSSNRMTNYQQKGHGYDHVTFKILPFVVIQRGLSATAELLVKVQFTEMCDCLYKSAIVQTGPKGVVEDWRRFKQLEVEKQEEQSKEKDLLAKRLALTCRSQVRVKHKKL